MKTIKFITSCLFLFFLTTGFTQEKYSTDYKIEYELEFSPDSLNLENRETEEMYLFSGSEYGVFVNKPRSEAEERMEEIKKKFGNSVSVRLGVNTNRSADLNKAFFKNLQTKEIKVLQELVGKDYVYIEENPIEWEITDETEEFMGYSVQKATTEFAGRSYEAWFTMEVPIMDGPYVFQGLPGLIVEIYDTEKHYHFKMITLDKLEEQKVWELPKTKIQKKDKVKKTQLKIDENALNSSDYSYMMTKTPGVQGSSMEAGGKLTLDITDKSGNKISKEELKRMYKEEVAKQNNAIELE